MKRTALLATSLALALAACGGSTPAPTTTTAARPSSTGQISITSPTQGQSVKGPDVVVEVVVTGATIVPKAVTNVTRDTGHVHISLDGKLLTLYAGARYTVKGVSPGTHIIQAEFVAADHGFFNPRVFAAVTFTAT